MITNRLKCTTSRHTRKTNRFQLQSPLSLDESMPRSVLVEWKYGKELQSELTPVHVFIVFPTKSISDLRFQIPKKAWKPVSSEENTKSTRLLPYKPPFRIGRPQSVDWESRTLRLEILHQPCLLHPLNVFNKIKRTRWHTCFHCFALHKTMAQVNLDKSVLDKNRIVIGNRIIYTLAYGRPVGVENAGSNRFPRSCASVRSSPWYQGRWKGWPVLLAYICPDKRPPSTRIVVSKTWGLVLTSKDTQSMTFRTAVSKPARSSRTTRVSRTSMSVREKLPATSLAAMFALGEHQHHGMWIRLHKTIRTDYPSPGLVLNMITEWAERWVQLDRYFSTQAPLTSSIGNAVTW